jgi:hypothetical protein
MINPHDASQAWPHGSLRVYGSVFHELTNEDDLIPIECEALHFLGAVTGNAARIVN